MKKTIFSLITLFFLANSSIFAQRYVNVNLPDLLRNIEKAQDLDGLLPPDVEGTPYLNEEWQTSTIQSIGNEEIEAYARFRYYDNVIEIKKDNDEKIYVLGKSSTKSISIGTQNFIALNYTIEGTDKSDFFELLAGGQLNLLIKYDKTMSKAVYNGYQDEPAKITAKRDYFVYDKSTKKMVSLKKMGKKSVAPFFGKQSGTMESYAKENKLSFKKADELAKIFAHYNATYGKKE